MDIDSAKLINLAAHGIKPSQIAAALGLTPGRITQILQDQRVIDLVDGRKAELASAEIDAITDIESINKTLLSNIHNLAGDTESLSEAVRAYEILDKMQRLKEGMGGKTAEDGIHTIVVQVPIFVQQALNIQVNNINEITSIDQRSMVAMPTVQVHKLIEGRANNDNSTSKASSLLSAEEGGKANDNHSHSRSNSPDPFKDVDIPPHPSLESTG